jgi:hypothetical protein
MPVTVEIPDQIVQQLEQTGEDLSRRLLEVIVPDAWRMSVTLNDHQPK